MPPLKKSQEERYGHREDFRKYRRTTPELLPLPFLKSRGSDA